VLHNNLSKSFSGDGWLFAAISATAKKYKLTLTEPGADAKRCR
jgi:hypothetical protein